MKKLVAILLAVSMIMAFALTASADEVSYTAELNVNWDSNPRSTATITGPGEYKLEVDMTYWGEGSVSYASIIIPNAYTALSAYTANLKVELGTETLYDGAITPAQQYVDDGTGNYVATDNYFVELYASWNSTNLVSAIPYGNKLVATLTLVDPNASEDNNDNNPSASGYTAGLGYADADWYPSEWGENVNTPVTGPGTYTLSYTPGAEATGAVVFVIDIGAEGGDAATVLGAYNLTALTITADGVDIPVDLTKVAVGDLEDKGRYRIEIYNEYSSTKENSPIDLSKLNFTTNLTVTFTLTDPNAVEEDTGSDSKPVVKPDSTNPKDGDALSAVVALLAVSACGIAVISKKKF